MNELIATFHIEWAQFFAQLVNFVIAMGILWFLIGRTLVRSLDSRREIIKKGVENGIESETILAQSKTQGLGIVQQAERDALSITANASHAASDTIAEAEHRAFLIERDLIQKAEKNAADTFNNELSAKKQETAKKIVQLSRTVLSKELSDSTAHSEYIMQQLQK